MTYTVQLSHAVAGSPDAIFIESRKFETAEAANAFVDTLQVDYADWYGDELIVVVTAWEKINLRDMKGELIASVPITRDEYGYLWAEHPTFEFELECALYGYQEGGVHADTIDDENGKPYIQWAVAAA